MDKEKYIMVGPENLDTFLINTETVEKLGMNSSSKKS